MNIDRINSELIKLKSAVNSTGRTPIEAGVSLANEIIKLLVPGSSDDLKYGEDALDEVIPTSTFPNTKTETWFQMHPYLGGERVALNLFEDDKVQIKFYHLNDSATKARISGSVMISPNWEDSKLTHNDEYKLGLDFFLTAKNESLLMVISDYGNLRVMEFEDRITHTQKEILEGIQGVFKLPTKDAIHQLLWDSLALSEVNKKFYEGISHHFNWLYQSLKDSGKPAEDAKLFSNRLLDRLLFLWFLRKKHIINEDFRYFDLPDEDSTSYYDNTLKKLFFETLNVEPGARRTKDLLTPYLDGGLFEAHYNDWRFDRIVFPNGYFNSLYDHLGKYNFTTDESSPEYEQVAIDPEMLGRIFENLLAEINPETEESARKQKGAFYTPREIVSYMCKESLRQYLYKEIGNQNFNSGIDDLIDKSDSSWELNHSNSKKYLFGKNNRDNVIPQIISALDRLKILDPACGSGAFPMGMMQLLLKTYERIEDRFDPYKLKLKIIENNIFGVDIEPMAVEISRLRVWLSVVVDDEKNDHNVEPLPNLDFKFVCADSLIPLDGQGSIFNQSLHEDLAEIRSKFFRARKPAKKDEYKKKYYNLTNGMLYDTSRDQQLKSFDPFKSRQPAQFFDPDYIFGEENFDIVIGNPPYVSALELKKILPEQTRSKYKKNYEAAKGAYDLYVLFFERGLSLLKKDGLLTYISPSKYLSAEYATSLRGLIVNKYSLNKISDFSNIRVFESAGVSTLVSFLSNNAQRETISINRFKNRTDSIEEHLYDKGKLTFLPNNLWGYLLNENIDLFLRIFSNSVTTESIAKVNACSTASEADLFEKNLTSTKTEEAFKFINNGTIDPYVNYWGVKPIRKNNLLTPWLPARIAGERRTKMFGGKKLIFVKLSKRPEIFYDPDGVFSSANTNMVYDISQDYSYEFLLGYYNSNIYRFMYSVMFGGLSMLGSLQFQAPQIRKSPVPSVQIADKDMQNQVADLVGRIIQLKNNDNDTEDCENELNSMFYQVYNLTDDDIKVLDKYTR